MALALPLAGDSTGGRLVVGDAVGGVGGLLLHGTGGLGLVSLLRLVLALAADLALVGRFAGVAHDVPVVVERVVGAVRTVAARQ